MAGGGVTTPPREGVPALTEDEHIGILKEVSDDRPDITTENAGTRLFKFIKAEAIRGFYTSRMGLKELDYRGNAFYAESPRCPE